MPINLEEGEAALIDAQHLVRSGENEQGERRSILGDNLPLAHVPGKGRASDLRLLSVSEMDDNFVGFWFDAVFWWIPTEYNVADGDSMQPERGVHATLVDRSVLKTCEFVAEPNVPGLTEKASPWIDSCVAQEATKVEITGRKEPCLRCTASSGAHGTTGRHTHLDQGVALQNQDDASTRG